jgi:thioredoxin 1
MYPTQIFYDAMGNELFRHEGFFSREDILAKWKDLGQDFESP